MSTSAEKRADELQAQVDALRAQAVLEKDLLDAKTSGDQDAIREAAKALRDARSLTRSEGTTAGGDAYVMTGEEG